MGSLENKSKKSASKKKAQSSKYDAPVLVSLIISLCFVFFFSCFVWDLRALEYDAYGNFFGSNFLKMLLADSLTFPQKVVSIFACLCGYAALIFTVIAFVRVKWQREARFIFIWAFVFLLAEFFAYFIRDFMVNSVLDTLSSVELLKLLFSVKMISFLLVVLTFICYMFAYKARGIRRISITICFLLLIVFSAFCFCKGIAPFGYSLGAYIIHSLGTFLRWLGYWACGICLAWYPVKERLNKTKVKIRPK